MGNDMGNSLHDFDIFHCKLPPWERCNCEQGTIVVLRKFKQFGDFVCVKPKSRKPLGTDGT